jgi:Zn-dependent protease/predicted transcriptional regulator
MDKNQVKQSGLPLCKLAGFEVRLDWSWIILAVLVSWTLAVGYFPVTFPGSNTATYWAMGIIGAIGLFLSIVLHELCHSLVGRYYGIPIKGITLFIFGGVAEMHGMPPNPKVEFLMSVVGPLFSIGLGILCYFLFQLGSYHDWPIIINGVIYYLSIINIAVGLFNLLPGFPLDGGRVFRSILWWYSGDVKWATSVASKGGVGLGFAMIVFGILLFIQGAYIAGFWMFLLGFFLQHISKVSYEDLLIREIFHHEHIKKFVKTPPISVQPHMTIQELVDNYFYHYYHKLYPVVEKGELVGCISFYEIGQVDKDQWPTRQVGQVMRQCTPDIVIDAETEVTEVLNIMTTQQLGRLIVTDHGKLYGMVTLKDMMNIIAIRMSLEEGNRH